MKKFIQLLLIAVMILSIFMGTWGCTAQPEETAPATSGEEISATPEETTPATREVVDLAERTVTVPAEPKKVATMQGPTYEMVFMLGAKDRIGLVRDDHPTAYPLALLTNPDLANYPTIAGVGPQSPVNVEEFINKGVDLVIYWNIEQELTKFDNAGIPALVINWSTFQPTNIEEALMDSKKQISFLADVLGGKAPERYADWESYLDETVEFIRSRTAQIPEDERPVVYWGNSWGPNILSTWPLTPKQFEVELCGGKLVSVEKGGQFPETTKEQLLAWEPEVIIVDNHGGSPEQVIEELKSSADWASLPAVKNDRLYRIPAGVFFLDKGTSRTVYYYWLAKQLHPDLFEDVDLIKELKYYFKTFYDYELTTEEGEKVLAGWAETRK